MIVGTRLDLYSVDATVEMELGTGDPIFIMACQHHLGDCVSWRV